jgi:sugar lactone lactonase YvrE
VTRYTPDGTIDRVIEMPVRTLTSCAFGGADLGTVYMTSASIDFVEGRWVYMTDEGFERNPTVGGIFAIDAVVRGLPEAAFTG